jgi:hypothetical protein
MATIKSARSVSGLYNLPTNGKTLEEKITGACLYCVFETEH